MFKLNFCFILILIFTIVKCQTSDNSKRQFPSFGNQISEDLEILDVNHETGRTFIQGRLFQNLYCQSPFRLVKGLCRTSCIIRGNMEGYCDGLTCHCIPSSNLISNIPSPSKPNRRSLPSLISTRSPPSSTSPTSPPSSLSPPNPTSLPSSLSPPSPISPPSSPSVTSPTKSRQPSRRPKIKGVPTRTD